MDMTDDPIIQKALAAVERKRQYVLGLAPHVAICREIIRDFGSQFADLRVSVGYENGSLNGALLMAMVKKIGEAAPILARLRKEHYKRIAVDDFAEIQRRTFNYGKIQFSVFFRQEDATACRFVEVRQEMKPVYQLLCPDGQSGEAAETEEQGEQEAFAAEFAKHTPLAEKPVNP